MKRAAFFDRDGTINVDRGHTHRLEDLEFIPGRPGLIRKYNDAGYLVIVATNQAGIAKGLYAEEDMHRFNAQMDRRLREEHGAHVDAFYFCPHHPDFTGECGCRKPKPGMLLKAIADFGIDARRSVMFGDSDADMEAAKACGVRGILI
jgi:D-glycero-D-manno-heptose 1,7-bisphosphate phosphatase